MKTRNLGDDFLRFLAIALVINSHMDAFYPIPNLGTGGAIGNALFFMLSSYGLLLSEKNKSQNFEEYFFKRVRRIYPAVWSAVLLLILPLACLYYFTSPNNFLVLVSEFHLSDPLAFASIIFYPPPAFWFLDALMIFYVVGFLLIKNYSNNKILIALFLSVSVYLVMYSNISDFSLLVIEQKMEFKLTFYFMIFLFGLFLASLGDRIRYSGKSDFFLLLLLLVLIYGHKVLAASGRFAEFQFVQQLLIFPLLFFCMKIARSDLVVSFMRAGKWPSQFISLLAAMTLELYIVHGPIRGLMLPYIGNFPGNVLLYLPLVFLISYGFYRLNRNVILWMSADARAL